MSADVIEQPTPSAKTLSRAKPSAAKSWLKAIELTSRIEADPSRLFADVVEDWSKRQPDRPALISDEGTFSYRTLAERINRYARWALSAGIEARRHRLPDHADAAGLHRRLARHHQGRRRRRADQHQAGRAVAVPLHQRRGRRSCHPRGGAWRSFRNRAALSEPRAENLDPGQPRQRREHRCRPGWNGRQSAAAFRTARRHHQPSRIADLHLGHHRPAEGRQHQPSPHPELGRLVRRTDGGFGRRPAVRLPAGLSQRRRHRRALQHAERGRLGGAGRQIFGERVLARRRALGLHAVPVYRRTLPLSPARAAVRI